MTQLPAYLLKRQSRAAVDDFTSDFHQEKHQDARGHRGQEPAHAQIECFKESERQA